MYINFSELLGKTLKSLEMRQGVEIEFTTTDNDIYKLYHEQDCCESVSIEDIEGNLADLVGHPLLQAEEVSDEDYIKGHKFDYEPESYSWTFYKLATIKGYVTIRWLGQSNGYYSESVSFTKIEK
jgi:hypothetical protein